MQRVVSAEHTRARWIANRLLAIGALEDHPARGEPINVRRLNVLRAIAAEFRPQIIRDDEEDIEFLLRHGCGGDVIPGSCDDEGKQEGTDLHTGKVTST